MTEPNLAQTDISTDGNQDIADLERRFAPKLGPNLLLWLVLGFVAVAILWAALTEIDRTVRGTGRIIPSSQLQIISNLEGGIIDAILVKTGQTVKAGDTLVRLDPTETGSELGSGSATVAALIAKVERLEAEISGRAPRFLSSNDTEALRQTEIERALYNARMAELSGIRGAAVARINAASRAVSEAESMLASRQAAARATQSELDAVRPLVLNGIEPALSLTKAQGAAQSASSEAAAASAAVARARAGVAEAQASYSQQVQDWKSRSANELTAAKAELSARQSMMPALSDRVDRRTVTAPVNGRINRVLVTTVGGTVQPGSPMVELVPSEDGLLVEAMVSPKDIASVRTGQKAKVSLTAYDSAVYGSLKGRVVAISPDAIVNEKTGESHYLVRVRTSENALKAPSGRKLPIGVGMVADVSLLGDKRTVLSYLLTPITRLSEEAFRE